MILILISLPISNTKATRVFFDDFNNGNLQNWNIARWESSTPDGDLLSSDWLLSNNSMISIDNGRLYFTTEPGIYLNDLNMASINSSVSYGTWSFDIDWINARLVDHWSQILFSMQTGNDIDDWNGINWVDWTGNISSYGLVFGDNPYQVQIRAGNNDLETELLDSILVSSLDTSSNGGIHHFDITRTSSGNISVYYDEVLILSAIDNTISNSKKFAIMNWNGAVFFDNIEIYDEIIPIPSTDLASSKSSAGSTDLASSKSSAGNSTENDVLFPYIIVGSGIVTITTAAYFTNRAIKKKE